MKKIFSILLAVLVASVSFSAMAAKKKTKYFKELHYFSMWGGAGYSGLVNNFSTQTYDANYSLYQGWDGAMGSFDPKFIGSGGAKLGLGYEMHHKRFIFAVGPEFRFIGSNDKWQFSALNTPDGSYQHFASVNVPEMTYGGDGMVLRYNFPKMMESQAVGQVMLPILFGGSFEKYYFLAGAKVGYTIFDFWNHKGQLETTVYDPMAENPNWQNITGMDHYFMTEDITSSKGGHPMYVPSYLKGGNKNEFTLPIDAAVTAEFGLNLNEFFSPEWNETNEKKKHPWHMRVGAFIDYGIPMLSFKKTTDLAWAATPANVTTYSMMQSRFADKKLSSLLVGVKFTALLQLNKPRTPNPRMQFFMNDAFTQKPLTSGKVAIRPAAEPGKKARKPQMKTMKRDGGLQQRYAKGTYEIWPGSNPSYLDAPYYYNGELRTEPIRYEHDADLRDSIKLSLIPQPKLFMYVHDASNEQLINATATFTGHKSGDSLTISSVVDTKMIFVQLPYGDTYRVHITAPNYHDTVAEITNLYDTVDYYLRPIRRVRRTLILKNMFFATDKTDILAASEADLMILYNFLSENPKIRILITGHTDSQGSDTYNQKLSEGRAASVKAEMVKRGIDESRMETDGKGESEPIDTNDTEEGRQNNRRVQITVLNAEDATVDVY